MRPDFRQSIEEVVIDQIASGLRLFSRQQNAYKFLCPYCQTGLSDRRGKPYAKGNAKGYLYQIGKTWNFKCHKCGANHSFAKFLETQFPLVHFEYVCLRDQLGTTGFQTNCPSLETVLKKGGILGGQPPEFHIDREKSETQQQSSASAMPISPCPRSTDHTCPPGFKVIIEPPMRSPQQQAGHQSRLNHQLKQRQQRRRLREGW